jgi:hypothetical protein
MKFLTVPDTKNLIVNFEFTEIIVTVRINLKWPNLDYLFCYLVGRHFTFTVITKRYIPWVDFMIPILRFGWL